MSKVSALYYLQGYKQHQIAKRLHISRPKVSRLLRQARKENIVQISVASPGGSFVNLETELEERYNLEEALVTEAGSYEEDTQTLKRQIGTAAAVHLQRTIGKGDVIGVSWGTTLQEMVQAVESLSLDDVRVVQTLGGVGPPEAKAHAADLARRLAHQLGSSLTLLPAPGIVDTPEAREVLLADQHVEAALKCFPKITTAYVGIGALSTNPIVNDDQASLSPEVRQELTTSKAVGDIALRYFDRSGRPIKTSLDERTLGITLEELQQINRVVGLAGGPQKLQAIRSALKGGLIDVLITDHKTASHLLDA